MKLRARKMLVIALCFVMLMSTIVLCSSIVSAEYEEPWVDNGKNHRYTTSSIPPDSNINVSAGADWYFYDKLGIMFNDGTRNIPGGWQTCQISINFIDFAESTRTYIVDEGIESIGPGATTTDWNNGNDHKFSSLTTVYISSTVKTIGSKAFSRNTVERVYIYSTDCEIADDAFNRTCTIYGYAESTAETYANERNITFIEFDETMLDKVFNYKEATCTEEGYSGDIVYPWNFLKEKGRTVEKLEHETITHEGKEATCTEAGYKPYETCENCDYSTYTVIPAKKHNYVVSSYVWSNDGKTCEATAVCSNDSRHILTEEATINSAVKEDSTCTEYGITTYTATFENELFTEQTKDVADIAPKEHNYVASYEWSDDGKSCVATAVCSNDNSHILSEEGEIGSAVNIEPTCTDKGTTTYTASFTNELFTEQTKEVADIPANGHKEVIKNAVDPTCTVAGYTGTVFCSVCDKPLSNGKEIKPLGHSFTNYVYNNDATYDKDGTETAKCNRCNETDTRTKSGTKLVNPTAKVKINVAKATALDYGTVVIIKATASNLDLAYHLVLVINGHEYEGNNKEVSHDCGQLKGDITYFVKVVDSKGNIQKDASGAELKKDGGKITCNDGFFKRIIAFFKGLFNALPETTVKPK